MSSTPALTAARVTRIAKQAAPEMRWSSEKGVRGILVRVWDAPADGTDRTELRLLNDARRLINATDLSATVIALRSRGGRSQFRILVTSEAQEAAEMQEAADARTAGEKLTVREAHAVITGTADAATEAKVTVREAAALERAEAQAAREAQEAPAVAAGVTDSLPADHPANRGVVRVLDERVLPARRVTAEESAVPELDPADGLSYRSIRAAAYEVMREGAVIGRIVRTTPPEHGRAALWSAYRPGGGQVTANAGSRRAAGAILAAAVPSLGAR